MSVCAASVEQQHAAYVRMAADKAADKQRRSSLCINQDDDEAEVRDKVKASQLHRRRLRVLLALKKEFTTLLPAPNGRASVRYQLRALVHEVTREAVDSDMVNLIGSMATVTTIFVRLDALIPALDRGDLATVQRTFLTLLDALAVEGGALRQFVRDDKGCVGIGVFGVPGHAYIDNAARALRCASSLVKSLADEGISSGVGVATGEVFSGLVGAHHRCEWAVMGPSVNLAARLMGKAEAGGILMDGKTHIFCKNQTSDFTYEALAPVKAKGYSDPVAVYRPVPRFLSGCYGRHRRPVWHAL